MTYNKSVNSARVTCEAVAAIGVACFGPAWQRPMAECFGVHRNTITAWEEKGAPANRFNKHLKNHMVKMGNAFALIHEHLTQFDH